MGAASVAAEHGVTADLPLNARPLGASLVSGWPVFDRRRLLHRRAFLKSLAAAALGPVTLGRRAFAQNPRVRVDATALRQRLNVLSTFGRPSGGTFADGVSRVAYSEADLAGRRYVMDLMRAAGLEPRLDPAGNIFGRRAGADSTLPPILFGSHIDSVPNGGNFDGDLGSLSSLGVLEALETAGLRTRHPLEMVVWANEEGVAFGDVLGGSRVVAGDLKSDMNQLWNGVTRADAIRKIGGNPTRITDAVRAKGAHHCYLELHIEQGATLDREKIAVGVVEGIVAIRRYNVTVSGIANHAGTTAMADRHDALLAASRLTIAVNDVVNAQPGRQVGTVGKLDVTPNAPNVIPGVVRLTIELRDLSTEKLKRLAEMIRQRASEIGKRTRTSIEFTLANSTAPATAAVEAQQAIERVAGRLGLASRRLPSGAGHDAQMMARLSPMGMIFVPSIGGISHSPRELTNWDHCAQGADVLLGTVLEMDRA
ncbi:MAG TPA: M20 family metallo-hydrolase [Gemmatimonadaceae bacterium]|nr:M20 family metallo-hydrolase [Gemmatimonadaceae bacterium]